MKKVKMVISLFVIFGLIVTLGCTQNDEKQIDSTIKVFLKNIEDNNFKEFRNMIIHKSPTMSDDHDFSLLHRLYEKSYVNENFETLNYTIIDSLDSMGKLIIKLPYFRGNDSVTAITDIDMILYFGPNNYFSLDKLYQFEIEKKWDREERGKLLGIPINKKDDSIFKATEKSVIRLPDGMIN